MASSTTIRSPSLTSSPSTTPTLTMVPCIGAARVFDEGALAVAPPVLRRVGRLTAGLAIGADSELGSFTSTRRLLTSTT